MGASNFYVTQSYRTKKWDSCVYASAHNIKKKSQLKYCHPHTNTHTHTHSTIYTIVLFSFSLFLAAIPRAHTPKINKNVKLSNKIYAHIA